MCIKGLNFKKIINKLSNPWINELESAYTFCYCLSCPLMPNC